MLRGADLRRLAARLPNVVESTGFWGGGGGGGVGSNLACRRVDVVRERSAVVGRSWRWRDRERRQLLHMLDVVAMMAVCMVV